MYLSVSSMTNLIIRTLQIEYIAYPLPTIISFIINKLIFYILPNKAVDNIEKLEVSFMETKCNLHI